MIKFSLIIPIYKVEDFLIRCISSVLSQTYDDFEIILVDDGSPDSCALISDNFGFIDDRIICIHSTNGGLSSARNTGIEVASGDFVFFLDSDDYLESITLDYINKCIDSDIDIVFIDSLGTDGISSISFSNYASGKYKPIDFLKNKFPVSACLSVFRLHFLNSNRLRFIVGLLHEDLEFVPKAILLSNFVYVTRQKLYHYYYREGSISHNNDMRKNVIDIFTTCYYLSIIYQNITDNEAKKRLEDELVYHFLSIYKSANGYRYKTPYFFKTFVVNKSHSTFTKIKATLFYLSPKLYCTINNLYKLLK